MRIATIALLMSLLLLVACEEGIRAKPVGEGGVFTGETELDACAEVTCGANALCNNGVCACQEGFKDCNGSCIGEDSCCSDNDCSENEICNGGKCTFTCEGLTCESNKLCFPKAKGCYCPDEYKWCDTQNKCIPQGNCCGKFDCDRRDSVCTRTVDSAKLCVIGNEKGCKFLGKTPKDFGVDGKTFTIAAKNFFYGDYVQLQINEGDINLTPGENVTIDGAVVHLDLLKQLADNARTKELI